MGKKIILLLIILSLVLGSFVLVWQLFLNKPQQEVVVETPVETVQEAQLTVTTRDILTERQPTIISDDELLSQIRNKKYLESSYLALEYSKISNTKLIEVLKNYLEDNLGTKPEDIREIIDLHERTFLNRYLKIYVLTPDANIQEVDSDIKNALYQMKSAYSTFAAYGRKGLSPEQIEAQANASADEPVSFSYSEMDPQFDNSSLKLGVQALENANTYVNGVLQKIGQKDIEIEKAWIDAQITSEDLTEVLNQTNVVYDDLSINNVEKNNIENKDIEISIE